MKTITDQEFNNANSAIKVMKEDNALLKNMLIKYADLDAIKKDQNATIEEL